MSTSHSNLPYRLHAQELEADDHDTADRLQQEDAGGLLRRARDSDRAVKLADLDSDVVDQVTDAIDLQLIDGQVELLRQSERSQSQFSLQRLRDSEADLFAILDQVLQLGAAVLRLVNDGADAHVLEEQVDPGVAIGVQHAVKVEHVVIDAILPEVEVLDRGDAENLRCLLQLGRVHLDSRLLLWM